MKIAAICGSLRRESYNMMILKIVAEKLKALGHEVEIIDINNFNVTLFNQDDEKANGMPDSIKKMKAIIHNAQAILVATPEYNTSVSGVLKNAIDWASRSITPDEGTYASFMGKPAGMIAASVGKLGGHRALLHLRHILSALGCNVMAKQVGVPEAQQMTDFSKKELDEFANKFDEFIRKLA